MVVLKYKPVSHDHKASLKIARKREGFLQAYNVLEEEFTLIREMLSARSKSGLTREAVAELMGTTKSAISRLKSAGKHAPSLRQLKKYARRSVALWKLIDPDIERQINQRVPTGSFARVSVRFLVKTCE